MGRDTNHERRECRWRAGQVQGRVEEASGLHRVFDSGQHPPEASSEVSNSSCTRSLTVLSPLSACGGAGRVGARRVPLVPCHHRSRRAHRQGMVARQAGGQAGRRPGPAPRRCCVQKGAAGSALHEWSKARARAVKGARGRSKRAAPTSERLRSSSMMGLVGLISSVFLLLMYMAMEESRRACRGRGRGARGVC